jgi:PPM family protein phosphatase
MTELLTAIIKGATDVGRVREINEDSYLVDEQVGFAIIADGLGGHAAGEIASKAAVEFVAKDLKQTAYSFKSLSEREITDHLVRTVAGANQNVFELAHKHPEFQAMGTTLDAVILVNDTVFIAHIGDGRIYYVGRGAVQQLTEDHRVQGIPNALSRALGTREVVAADSAQIRPDSGDSLVLCTDGVWSYFESSPDEIGKIVEATGTAAAAQLVKTSLERGGCDNATAVVMSFRESKAA